MTWDELRELDSTHTWHPFTPTSVWESDAFRPVFIERGEGATLIDSEGKRYLDGNSSIWVNLHGHAHPKLTAAMVEQLGKIAHSSYLGLAHEPGARLSQQLNATVAGNSGEKYRTFLSDNGSTAMEVGLKMVFQYFQQNGAPERSKFLSLDQGYHGDTVGAMSAGHSATFHGVYAPLLFKSEKTMAPACYRCPYNQAKPEQADARTYRKCHFECAGLLREKIQALGSELAAIVLEPKVQGAASMLMHPEGFLQVAAEAAHEVGAKLIVDEVFVGLGRTGTMLASHAENVFPDVVALGKGLAGGYSPLAATVVKENIFDGFRGGVERTFYHGHSFSGHQLGCAAALQSLALFEEEKTLERIATLSAQLREESQIFWKHPNVGDVRQEGLILAVELVAERSTRAPFPNDRRLAFEISEKARDYGLLTRGIGHTLVLIPQYCTIPGELSRVVSSLNQALHDILPV